MMNRKAFTLNIIILIASCNSFAQTHRNVNYDESRVPSYVLPELLNTFDNMQIYTFEEWEAIRKPELLEAFSSEMYGRTPDDSHITFSSELLYEDPAALNGLATLKQINLIFHNGERSHEALLMLLLPNNVSEKTPVIVGYNFKGNHSTTLDSNILYSKNFPLVTGDGHPDWERGCQKSRWPFVEIINRGYAVATMCYHDIFPDKPGLKAYSVMALFDQDSGNSHVPDEWQAIGAWAWGSSRIVDYLLQEERIDTAKVVIMGHSRQGKAALWAGAQDNRFQVVIANNSGEGGAALSRREFGETIEIVSSIQPSWFCAAFNKYRGKEQKRSVDQHQLLALIAPRGLYIASAEEDLWADPKGEYLSAYHASPVYELYGLKGLSSIKMPKLHEPLLYHIGYHIRRGKHDVTLYDWNRFMDFADKIFLENGKM